MSALYTALLEGESKESLARMVCEHRAVLRAYETWEADVFLEDECWRYNLPVITQALWDRLVAIQELRNSVLHQDPAP